jgi:serine phosphatase RsbU (regulator of sigma subunit)
MKITDWLRIEKIKNKILVESRTLRGQLIISVWLGLMGIFVPLNIIDGIHDVNVSIQRTESALVGAGSFVYFGVRKWRKDIKVVLNALALSIPVRDLNKEEAEIAFAHTRKIFPYRSMRLWNSSGDLIAGTNVEEPVSRSWAFSHPSYVQAREGSSSYEIYSKCLTGNPCYVESIPVYSAKGGSDSRPSNKPIGVLSVAIDLSDTGKDSELSGVYDKVVNIISDGISSRSFNSPWKTALSLQNKDYEGMEILMVSRDGYLIFPTSDINDTVSLQSPRQIARGPWGPLVRIGLKASKEGKFGEIQLEGREYFVYSRVIDPQWRLVAVSDKNSSYKYVYDQIFEQIIYQIITLAGMTIVVALVCKKAASPILLAASTIREFSHGHFEARISTNRTDEIGQLFVDINQTGANLRELLINKLKHAVTDQQIKTAKEIQKSFIVENLPTTTRVELAGSFEPAHEIGADWYDALSLGDVTYIIIADVCDKGIASALFMSVFRSLMRYSLLDKNKDGEESGLKNMLEIVVAQVNNYMAANHGISAMFATLFLGAYVNSTCELNYVCAGHEIPIIIRSKGAFEHLEPTGPAVGIFANAKYKVNTVSLMPGEILFMYTDGLVDARSPSNTSWGIEGVYGVLANINPNETTAKELLGRVSKKVDQHREDADQFDDLTMLVMKINKI